MLILINTLNVVNNVNVLIAMQKNNCEHFPQCLEIVYTTLTVKLVRFEYDGSSLLINSDIKIKILLVINIVPNMSFISTAN